MNKYQLSLCRYEKKNQHSKRGRVGGDTHDDSCGNVAFRGTGCRETTVAVDPGGGILPGRGVIHAVFVSRNDSIVRGCVVQPALLFRGVG